MSITLEKTYCNSIITSLHTKLSVFNLPFIFDFHSHINHLCGCAIYVISYFVYQKADIMSL